MLSPTPTPTPTPTPASLDTLGLSADHRARISASAVSPAVAAARGYRTIPESPAGRAELERLGFSPYQWKLPALLIPCYGVSGQIAIHQIRPDSPRLARAKATGAPRKAIKYETPAGSRMVLDVPRAAHPQIGDPSVPLWVTEGARKADAAVSHGLCCVALLGVDNWRGTNEEGGKAALGCWQSVALNGRDVYVAFDSDVMEKAEVAKALVRFRAFLASRDARVHLVYLPPAAGGAKVGLDDFFASGGTADALRALATQKIRGAQPSIFDPPEAGQGQIDGPTSEPVPGEAPAPATPPPAADRPAAPTKPRLIVTTETSDLANQVEAALVASAAFLFQQNGRVVEPARLGQRATSGAPADAAVVVHEVRLDRMIDIASQHLTWMRTNEEGELRATRPDKDTLRAVLARPLPRFRYLRGVVMAPCLRADGTVLSSPGYDADSGLLFADSRTRYPAIPDAPTLADAQRAHATLCDVFADFPFLKPCDRAAILSSLLTLLSRHAIDGPVPLVVVRSPTPGTGKSLLVDVVSTIATGRGASRYIQAQDPEAERKLLFAIANDGEQIGLFDNIAKPLGSPALDATLTSMTVGDRVMGTNTTRRVPFTACLFATGNNIQLRGDLCRRVIVVDLDAETERPEESRDRPFRHPDLIGYVRAHRGELVAAALTIMRAFVVANRPRDPELRVIGSFEAWDRLVRGALCWVSGYTSATPTGDPAESRSRIREDGDPEVDALRELLEAWRDTVEDDKPVSAAKLVQYVRAPSITMTYPFKLCAEEARTRLRYALAGMDAKLDVDRLDHKRIGYALRKFKGRIVEGMKIESGGKGEDGVSFVLKFLNMTKKSFSCSGASSAAQIAGATYFAPPLPMENASSGTQPLPWSSNTPNPEDAEDESSLPSRARAHAHARTPACAHEAEVKSIFHLQPEQLTGVLCRGCAAEDGGRASSGFGNALDRSGSVWSDAEHSLSAVYDAAERAALAEESGDAPPSQDIADNVPAPLAGGPS